MTRRRVFQKLTRILTGIIAIASVTRGERGERNRPTKCNSKSDIEIDRPRAREKASVSMGFFFRFLVVLNLLQSPKNAIGVNPDASHARN